MTQTKVYTLEAFIGDVQKIFASTRDPRAQAQGIAKHLIDQTPLFARLAEPAAIAGKQPIPVVSRNFH